MSKLKLVTLAVGLTLAVSVAMADDTKKPHVLLNLDCTVIVDGPAPGGRTAQAAEATVQVLEMEDRITISGVSKHPGVRFTLTSYGPTPTVQRFNRSDAATWAVETRDVNGAALSRAGVNKSTLAFGLQKITAVPGQAVYVSGTCKRSALKGD